MEDDGLPKKAVVVLEDKVELAARIVNLRRGDKGKRVKKCCEIQARISHELSKRKKKNISFPSPPGDLVIRILAVSIWDALNPSYDDDAKLHAISALDQLEELRIPDKNRIITSSCLEISSKGEEDIVTSGFIGTSFPPLLSTAHFPRCGFQGSLQKFQLPSLKTHSESDLSDIRIMSNESSDCPRPTIEEDDPDGSPPVEVEEVEECSAEEEPLFAMDEDESSQEAFRVDNCVITNNDVQEFLSGLQEDKVFDKDPWDKEEEDEESDDESGSSSLSTPINVKSGSKFECSLSTIQASPLATSSMTENNPTICIINQVEEDLTPLQKKIIESHPPTKPSNEPEKKFLEVKDNKGRKLRRATSLKAYTSPEEKSDTQKKISTKTFNNGIPTVPKSAYLYLRDVELSDTESDTSSRGIGGYPSFYSSRPTRSITPPTGFTRSPEQIVAKSGLAPQFTQPGVKEDFNSIVNNQALCLECAYVSVNGCTLSGVVAVKNISFHKNVSIRYTIDDWQSFSDSEAIYSSTCPTSGFDKFSFDINFPAPISLSQRLQCCIRYSNTHGDFWDNNFGANYTFKSLTKFDKMSASVSQSHIKRQTIISQYPSCSEDPWLHF
ncbi:Uncharacterized protein FKW44_003867, partial [Caligus rogercresseyi]